MFFKRSEIFEKKYFGNTVVECGEWRICEVKNLAWTKLYKKNLTNWIEPSWSTMLQN